MTPSFLWFDLETFGRDPRTSRIAQVAGIRTDADLDEIGAPLTLYCRPADDLLPSPAATLVTGLTPQQARRDGVIEAEFIAQVHEALAEPGTCAVGYNSLRFDDEFLRYGLYRNFHDPYEREWRNGNSRWDLLDLMRLAQALRPEGIEWPRRDDGAVSFRLDDLADANGLREGRAHEAMSDVRALLSLARRLRRAQPKLWDYYYALRDKTRAASLLDVANTTPLLHVSSRYPALRHCAALVAPLAWHPTLDSRVIVYDLDAEPDALLRLDADEIADRLYTPAADLPEGAVRVPLKEIHLNRCPALVRLAHLRAEDFARLGLDRSAAVARAARLREMPGLAEKVRRVFSRPPRERSADVDAALYDGFLPDADRRQFATVRGTPPDRLGTLDLRWADPRLPELLFRYRARNWPQTLTAEEAGRWNDYRRQRLDEDRGWSEYTFTSYRAEIASLRAAQAGDGRAQALLDALEAWGLELEQETGNRE